MVMKLWKSIKAISSIIAVIILIAITISGGLLVFALMTSTLTGGNQKTQVNFESLSLYRSTGEPEVLFATTIKNTGNRPIKQLTLKVHNESDYAVPSVTASTPLEPGRTVGVTLTPPKITAERYVVGNAYSVTVEAEAVDGSAFSTVASVKCLGVGGPSVGQKTITCYSTANDGYIEGWSANYSTVWSASTYPVFDEGDLYMGQCKYSDYYIYRSFLFFDTSSLPDDAVITSAMLSLYGSGGYHTTDFNITIQNGQPNYPHAPLQEGDYAKGNYSGNGGQFDTTSYFEGGWNNITLNSDGISWISKAGTTKLCLRSDREIGGIEPNIDFEEFVTVCANEAGEGYEPKLVITYTSPVTPQTEEMFEYCIYEPMYGEAVYETDSAQTFTPQIRHKLSKVVLCVYRSGNPAGDFIVSIRNTDVEGKPTGGDLVSKSVLANSINIDGWEIIEMVFDTQITLEADTKYAIILSCPDGDGENYIVTATSEGYGDIYPRGVVAYWNGETWVLIEDYDFWFEEWGYA